MRYMIHACPQRMWYVNDYLLPSLKAQGIPEEEIAIWNDTEGKGTLFSCLESFKACGKDQLVMMTMFPNLFRSHLCLFSHFHQLSSFFSKSL